MRGTVLWCVGKLTPILLVTRYCFCLVSMRVKLPFLWFITLLLDWVIEGDGHIQGLKYVWGDALSDPNAVGPDGEPYPWDKAKKIAGRQRIPRVLFDDEDNLSDEDHVLLTPEETRQKLLSVFGHHENAEPRGLHRQGRSDTLLGDAETGCVPPRMCETTYNTTAPMYGISLTSGKPVTIVQKFPDLLQQVVYQVCKSEECDVIQGKCVQTYLPYLFLVIPLGPVTLTGQDYVLVESGCACKPKYAKDIEEPPPIPIIQPLNMSTSSSVQRRTNKRF